VTNVIERLATAVYREACANAEQRLPKTGGPSEVVCPEPRTARTARRSQSRFHFYQHLPPAGGVREAFDCIALRFEDDEYRDPRWFGYPVIPELIQSARFDIARDASPSDAKGYRLPVGATREVKARSQQSCHQPPFRQAPELVMIAEQRVHSSAGGFGARACVRRGARRNCFPYCQSAMRADELAKCT
jgi:hypothetical protein